jgi:hypothetical protein
LRKNYSEFHSIVPNSNIAYDMSSDAKKANQSRSAEQKRHESEEQLNLLQTITTELATAEDLSSALEVVLRDVCEKTGWMLGHAWVPNPERTALSEPPLRHLAFKGALGFPGGCGNRNGLPGSRTSRMILIFRDQPPRESQI